MSSTPDPISDSYAFCRRLTRGARSNLIVGMLLLPADQRRAMETLYAFMRHTDDLADSPAPADQRRQALGAWREALKQAIAGGRNSPDPVAASLLPALGDAVRRFSIPPEHLRAVIDGVEMDLDTSRYETFADLEPYCRRVASAVGLACIHVWGFHGPEAIQAAEKAGIALQLTNILRDLKEDALAGRVYLPLEDLRHCGYTAEELARGAADERFRRLVELEADRADGYYRQAAPLVDLLNRPGSRVFGMMIATYHALLEQIRRRPEAVLQRRLRVGRWRKLRIAARWLLLPPGEDALR